MGEVISPRVLEALAAVTGEVHLDSALRIVAREAIDHRLAPLAERIRTLEHTYGSTFEACDTRCQAGEIPDQYGYAVEQDDLDWEGLVCRQQRLREAREWVR